MAEQTWWILALGLTGLVYVAVAYHRALGGYTKLSFFVFIASAVALGWCGYIGSRTLLPVTFPGLAEHTYNVAAIVGVLVVWGVLHFPSIVNRLAWITRGSRSSITAVVRAMQFWKRRSLEEMLAVVAHGGIRLRAQVAASSLWPPQSAERRQIEKGGFETLLSAMSEHSDDVWHFDVEAIYDHGDYKDIVDNLCRLSRGALAFEAVNDFVDVANGIAWVDLTRDGKTERIELKVDNDWVDERIFSAMQSRLIASGSDRRIVIKVLGQDCLIACMAPDDMLELCRATFGSVCFEPM
jgi:hypothetical protein